MNNVNKLLNNIRKIGVYLAYTVIIILTVGFWGLLYSEGNQIEGVGVVEKPFVDIEGFVVDEEGKVYVGLGYSGVVQIYDSNGLFLRNWRVDNKGGSFKINLAENNKDIIITTIRGDEQIVYDEFGNIINSVKQIDIFFQVEEYKGQFISPNGSIYKQKNTLFPYIERVHPTPKIIVSQNIIKSIFQRGPIVVLIIIILISYIVINHLIDRRS